jgi:protein-disulfide isomerase
MASLIGIAVVFAPWTAGLEAATQAEALLEALQRGPGPSKGSPDAPVTMVEFSDFQCSFCKKFWRETLPRIEEKYIRTGKVRFVYRHLAILGPPSVQAAMAAECAQEQGRFWPYHDRLFASAGPFGFSSSNLKRYAKDLQLDSTRFNTCLDTEQPRERVERETMVGRAIGMTGTPGFLINGGRLIGAQPYEVFERIIESMLEAAGKGQGRKR